MIDCERECATQAIKGTSNWLNLYVMMGVVFNAIVGTFPQVYVAQWHSQTFDHAWPPLQYGFSNIIFA